MVQHEKRRAAHAGRDTLRCVRHRRSKTAHRRVVLIAKSNPIDAIRPLVSKLLASLSVLPPRTLVQIGD